MNWQKELYKISVIVPVYNAENFLEKCVDSILNQTYYKLEFILGDENTNDNFTAIYDLSTKERKGLKLSLIGALGYVMLVIVDVKFYSSILIALIILTCISECIK